MNNNKMLSLLGLATRARKVVIGEGLVLDALRHHQGAVLFLAADAGQNITKKIEDKAKTYQIHLIRTFSTSELSHAMGKTARKIVLVTDKGFCTTFIKYINS